MIRTFVAVQLPKSIRDRLAEIEDQLIETGADVKWVPKENFHITLKFLGAIEACRLEMVKKAVESASNVLGPFDVVLEGVGAFPTISKPRVIWVGLTEGAAPLKALAERVECALEAVGFEREARGFSPHVTIGRVRSLMTADKLREAMKQLRTMEAGSFTVDSVKVMKSDLHRDGPVYTPIADFALTGK